jgi:hypothetical protein
MSKPTKSATLLRIALAGLCLLVAVAVWVNYSGGYWENTPVLDRISGPQRFRQFIVNPIPSSVRDVRGGYSGFPFGYIRTVFAYSEEPLPFLDEWTQVDGPEMKAKIRAANFSHTKVFQKDSGAFLLIDANARRGCLYVPGG